MPVNMKIDWSEARADYEAGMSQAAVARKYEVSVSSVRNHKKSEGWIAPADDDVTTENASFTESVIEAFGDDVIDVSDDPSIRIAQLEAELAASKAQLAEASDDIKVTLYDTVAGVIDYFGADRIAKIARTKLNAERKAQGFPPVELALDNYEVQEKVQELAEELLSRRTKFAGENNLRTVKMAYPDQRMPQGYRLVAIPVEPTFNDEVARPGRALSLQRAKGFKLAVPVICHRGPCWLPAAQANGKLTFEGYCSEAHMNDDPFLHAKKVGGVTVRRQVKLGA